MATTTRTKEEVIAQAEYIRWNHKLGLLSVKEVRQYESLPNWKWNVKELSKKTWDKRFEEVKKNIKKRSDWEKPENYKYKMWALIVLARKAAKALATK